MGTLNLFNYNYHRLSYGLSNLEVVELDCMLDQMSIIVLYKLSLSGIIQYSDIIKIQVGLSGEEFIAAVFCYC